MVDLDGAKSKHIVNHKVLEEIATKTRLKIDFGGGLKTDEDLRIAFESGAQQITGGSIAVKNPETFTGWIQQYGADKIILGADVKGEYIATDGWLETSDQSLFTFLAHYQNEGCEPQFVQTLTRRNACRAFIRFIRQNYSQNNPKTCCLWRDFKFQ